jgi:ribosomal protein L6P/L9E
MRYIHSFEQLPVPEGSKCPFLAVWARGGVKGAVVLTNSVKVSIKSRFVTVEGPRGKLSKDLKHMPINLSVITGASSSAEIKIEIHHGARKNVALLRTVRTLIENMFIGVTKGFLYKMRYVYAHFPINVNVEKNAETGLYTVEIRYVACERGSAPSADSLTGTLSARRLCEG